MKIEMHYPAKGDLPELSGEMRAERHRVLAYTKSLGWTQAIRRRVGKKKFEWVCRTEEKAYDNLSEAINDRSIEQFLEEVKK